MSSLKYIDVPIHTLTPNPWNTNVVTPENEQKIEHSLKRFGMYRPLIVRETKTGYEIIGGQHRWQVAKKLGYTTVPVINLGVIDDSRAKEIGLVDNGRYGEDDTLALAELLKDLGDTDELLEFLPYSGDELESIFASTSIALDDLDLNDDDEKIPELPMSKAAQTHQIMRFKVPVGDAAFVQRRIEMTMKQHGFSDDDSMMNAGHALVVLLKGDQ